MQRSAHPATQTSPRLGSLRGLADTAGLMRGRRHPHASDQPCTFPPGGVLKPRRRRPVNTTPVGRVVPRSRSHRESAMLLGVDAVPVAEPAHRRDPLLAAGGDLHAPDKSLRPGSMPRPRAGRRWPAHRRRRRCRSRPPRSSRRRVRMPNPLMVLAPRPRRPLNRAAKLHQRQLLTRKRLHDGHGTIIPDRDADGQPDPARVTSTIQYYG
jgi:hypothetical protein